MRCSRLSCDCHTAATLASSILVGGKWKLKFLAHLASEFQFFFLTCFFPWTLNIYFLLSLICHHCSYQLYFASCLLLLGRKLNSMNSFQICSGLARLQATYRARVLALKYLTLRERMKIFQAFCRGFLARQEYKNRLRSIIKIQSGIRMVLAKRRTQELRVEVSGIYRTSQ